MKIVTHDGHFHADELLAVATLILKYSDAEVVRSRDENIIESADITVDVGHIYDPLKMRFDHHQPAGAGKHYNDLPYASFGLIWKEFGEELAGGKDEARLIEDKLVIPIDAGDNGIDVDKPLYEGIRKYSLWDFFRSFSDEAGDMEQFDQGFRQALVHATEIIKREIGSAKRSVEGWKEVEQIYNESENKKIIVLPENLHYKKVLVPSEALFVIRPRPDGKWSVRGVPPSLYSFEVKKPFPESWAGLEGELANVSGVEGAMFCHRNRWLAGAHTKEGAMKLAEIALNA